ncbi:YqaA family protein [Clostridium magnum]|uniref:SNARE associated golgi protein n=1 Tax=Clostridium magnum DSM 2767 TaxID=1121326 RepID=A0A161WWX1_9CLOT|nr:VTT domain-containing protein [Clostridium magnum]KZL91448.1 SNARE associated golgi protein [Clostridium magnum DSM 2767]SHH42674.1 membrane protein YqaA, SNARE-associated domain [Clostridium magnum DSM 2767]
MLTHMLEFIISYGVIGILIAALVEPIFMPVPMELVFIPVAMSNPKKAFFYSIILIAFSAIGSLLGYIVGKSTGRHLLCKLVSEKTLTKIEDMYNKNAFLTILTSAFTPIPYEAYVLSAGIFKINFKKFITSAVLSRVIRYIPQGIIISLYGDALINIIKNYTIALGLIVFIMILLIKKAKTSVS